MDLATFDLLYLVKEWQHLVGGRIQKVYMKERLLILQVYHKGNSQWLFTDNKSFLSEAKIAFPQKPSGFCMFLRKRIQGCRISSIQLLGVDRIVSIGIETKEGSVELIVELFQKVNYLFCKDGKIVSAFETHTYTDRTVRGGVQYIPPPSKPAPWDVDLHTLVGKSAAKTLATELSLGGKYAEETCVLADIDSKGDIVAAQLPKLKRVVESLRDHEIAAHYTEKEALPFPFRTKPGTWHVAESFSKAIDAIERKTLESHELAKEGVVQRKQLSKQEKILASQRAQLQKLELVSRESQRKGELIYEHYGELQHLFEAIKQDWKTHSYKHIKEKYEAHKLIKAVHADGTIEVELADEPVSDAR